jgi:putative transposase
MPRHARFVLPGVPHHVTQRGNHRETVFFCQQDYLGYLQLLRQYALRHAVEIVSYCLMPNHIHLVAVPADVAGLHRLLRAVHGQYAQRINRANNQTGHLWQARYFSSPLDAAYFLNAVRYVELNPVRARLASLAEQYRWSSAGAHCGIRSDLIVDAIPRSTLLSEIANWSRWLAAGVDDGAIDTLRRNGSQNLPCGSTDFVRRLERAAGRDLEFKPRGRSPEAKKAKKGDSHI